MKKLIISVLSIQILLTSLVAFDSAATRPEEQERLALVVQRLKMDEARTWPTLQVRGAPLVISFASGDIFALNLKHTSDWDVQLVEGMEILKAKEDKWGILGIQMQSDFEIGGKRAFIYKMGISDSAVQDVTILFHERFHRHQGENFSMLDPQGSSLDHLDEENLTWADIEDRLIRDFLSGENQLEALKDFVAVTKMRRSAIQPESLLWENGQLRMEGLADYAATKGHGDEGLLLAMHPEVDHEEDFIDEAIKWRHYLAGAFMGYALDFTGSATWKMDVEKGAILPELLIKAVPLTKAEEEKRIQNVARRLNYKKRRKKIAEKINKQKKQVSDLVRMYDEKEGIRLFIEHPKVNISGGGTNEKMVYIDGGALVALSDASIATSVDGLWSFETKRVSHLFQHPNGVREVKVARTFALTINEMEVEIQEGGEPKEFLFNSLEIKSGEVALSSKEHSGVLISDDAGLHVRY